MKITQKQLKQIIKEEVEASIDEGSLMDIFKYQTLGMKNKKIERAIELFKIKINEYRAEVEELGMGGVLAPKFQYNSLLKRFAREIGDFRDLVLGNTEMNDNQKTESRILIDRANRLYDQIESIRDDARDHMYDQNEGLTREALEKIIKEDIASIVDEGSLGQVGAALGRENPKVQAAIKKFNHVIGQHRGAAIGASPDQLMRMQTDLESARKEFEAVYNAGVRESSPKQRRIAKRLKQTASDMINSVQAKMGN